MLRALLKQGICSILGSIESLTTGWDISLSGGVVLLIAFLSLCSYSLDFCKLVILYIRSETRISLISRLLTFSESWIIAVSEGSKWVAIFLASFWSFVLKVLASCIAGYRFMVQCRALLLLLLSENCHLWAMSITLCSRLTSEKFVIVLASSKTWTMEGLLLETFVMS